MGDVVRFSLPAKRHEDLPAETELLRAILWATGPGREISVGLVTKQQPINEDRSKFAFGSLLGLWLADEGRVYGAVYSDAGGGVYKLCGHICGYGDDGEWLTETHIPEAMDEMSIHLEDEDDGWESRLEWSPIYLDALL